LLRRGKRGVVKEMLVSKDSKGVASAKKELFLGRRITMQGLVYSYVRGNRQNTEENALLFPF
jgi:hypothetical protein